MLTTPRRALAVAVRRALDDARERRVSLRRAAQGIGVSHSHLSAWRDGYATPTPSQVAALLEAIGTPGRQRGPVLALARDANEPEPGLSVRIAQSLMDAAAGPPAGRARRILESLAAHSDASAELCATTYSTADLREIAAHLPDD